ncbi:hypothetical protein CDAR_320961 [Caerostris darwini]|uniref:Uncharacterized protein n=1 Tax=Caerostris darwini TaxID=1538125 RepID=A0AAV4X048_9ARAC|nr:hypothetical protein CDAR_320961 [Caerostris darwini]
MRGVDGGMGLKVRRSGVVVNRKVFDCTCLSPLSVGQGVGGCSSTPDNSRSLIKGPRDLPGLCTALMNCRSGRKEPDGGTSKEGGSEKEKGFCVL